MSLVSDLSNNRYAALEEVRGLLRFRRSEWKCLLTALSKTDNGWFQFMHGDLTIDFKKFVDIDELHLHVELKKDSRTTKSAHYVYELSEFTKPNNRKVFVDSCRK